MTWLREAEEEEENSEDEEDDEVAFENGHRNGIAKSTVIAPPQEDIKVKAENGEEIDIDDIWILCVVPTTPRYFIILNSHLLALAHFNLSYIMVSLSLFKLK